MLVIMKLLWFVLSVMCNIAKLCNDFLLFEGQIS